MIVCITDDGPGIAPDVITRIFEPFYTTKPMGKGTGLGLDISRRIILSHRGTITASSRPGETVFTVHIPAETGALQAEPAASTPTAGAAGAGG